MTGNMNTIIYAAVTLKYKSGCKIISDTLNEKPYFRSIVYQILYTIKYIEKTDFCIYKSGYSIHFRFREYTYVCITRMINDHESTKIQQCIAQQFLKKLEEAYLESPREFDINKPPERNTFPIKTFVINHNIQHCHPRIVEQLRLKKGAIKSPH